MKHCPHCGSPEVRAIDAVKYECLDCGEVFLADVAVAVDCHRAWDYAQPKSK